MAPARLPPPSSFRAACVSESARPRCVSPKDRSASSPDQALSAPASHQAYVHDHQGDECWRNLIALIQHPQRAAYLPDLVAFLGLDDTAWAGLDYLRTQLRSPDALKSQLPRLYNLPDDLWSLLCGVRTGMSSDLRREIILNSLTGWCLARPRTPFISWRLLT